VDALVGDLARHVVEVGEKPEGRQRRHFHVQRRLLGEEAEPVSVLSGVSERAVHLDATGGRLDEARNRFQRRRLASAVRADDPEHLAGGGAEGDIVHGHHAITSTATTPPYSFRRLQTSFTIGSRAAGN